MYAASALAANTVCRSAAGAAAPLFTTYMFDALGVGGGGSLIGGMAVLLAPIPFVFYKYGGPIRERSKFAPTPAAKRPNAEPEGIEKVVNKDESSPERTRRPSSSSSSASTSSASSIPHTPRESTYQQEGYIEEGIGYDRVARPDDTRVHDAGQLKSEP